MLAVLIVSVGGCKKTETEQISHYQSQNHRILGTWKLQNSSDVETIVTTTTSSNDVNSTTSDFTQTETITTTFNGSTYTTSTALTSNLVTKDHDWDNPGNPVVSQITTNTTDIVSTVGSTWNGSSVVSIWRDYTYDDVITTYQNQIPFTPTKEKTATSNVQTTTNGTLTGISSDTTFVNMDEFIATNEGGWFWLDGSHNPLERSITAGPMGGNIISLSSAKCVIGENDKQNDKTTDLIESLLETYTNNQNPTMTQDGITTIITTIVSNRIYTETWDKTSSETMP